jgi:hypothetical protein
MHGGKGLWVEWSAIAGRISTCDLGVSISLLAPALICTAERAEGGISVPSSRTAGSGEVGSWPTPDKSGMPWQ